MQKDKRTPMLVVAVLIILVAIPLTVWLVLNTAQLLDRRAAEDEVTINLVPAKIVTSLGETFNVDIYVNSGDIKVSAATISLNVPETSKLTLESLQFLPTEDRPYDDTVYNKNEDPYTFTILAKRADSELPSGSFKIATATFQAVGPNKATISVNTDKSDVVGVKTDSDQTNFTIVSTESNVTTQGELCRVDACTLKEDIQLIEQPRNDLKYNIQVAWDPPQTISNSDKYFFRLYRNVGSAVSDPHKNANLVSTTIDPEFLDTNSGSGFQGSKTVYYDIDTYIVCPGSVTDPTATNTPVP